MSLVTAPANEAGITSGWFSPNVFHVFKREQEPVFQADGTIILVVDRGLRRLIDYVPKDG